MKDIGQGLRPIKIELSVVQSRKPIFDPGLLKNIKKPQIPAKMASYAPNKKGVLLHIKTNLSCYIIGLFVMLCYSIAPPSCVDM